MRIDVVRVHACRFERVALRRTGEGEEQRRDDRVERWLVHVPLDQTVLAHRQPGVERGDVRRRGGRELRGEFGKLPARGLEFLEKWLVLEFLEETPAEAIGEEQDHRVHLSGREQVTDAERDGGKSAGVVAGFDEVGMGQLGHGILPRMDSRQYTTRETVRVTAKVRLKNLCRSEDNHRG
jgi:hypothetical protein